MRNTVVLSAQPSSPAHQSLSVIHPPLQQPEIAPVSSPPPVGQYAKILSKRCLEIYKVDKFYVGLLRELPPPGPVQEKWEQEVQPDLESHLCQATKTLSRAMRDEEVITELVLCMAGKKCSPASVASDPAARCLEDPVLLIPTVWIYCGSRKCKKKVVEAVRNLTYLKHFLVRFSMHSPHASLYAPWPAVREDPPHPQHLVKNSDKISFAIEDGVSQSKSICGTRVKFIIEASSGIIQHYSTIGGFIVVDGKVFAMTSAHSIVNYLLDGSGGTSEDDSELTSGTSSDSGSDTDSESGSNDVPENPCSSTQQERLERPFPVAEIVHVPRERNYIQTKIPEIIAYMGRGTITGDYSFPLSAPDTADFALIDKAVVSPLSNTYYNPELRDIVTISSHISTHELPCGDVWIISNHGVPPIKGYLLAGVASIILRGTVMRTKKIQVNYPGGK